jgi:hypothetical protein
MNEYLKKDERFYNKYKVLFEWEMEKNIKNDTILDNVIESWSAEIIFCWNRKRSQTFYIGRKTN